MSKLQAKIMKQDNEPKTAIVPGKIGYKPEYIPLEILEKEIPELDYEALAERLGPGTAALLYLTRHGLL